MHITVLSSGSGGNTTYLEINNKKILIDCGNTNKYIKDSLQTLGVSTSEIDYIFLTHTHRDHVLGLPVFLKKNHPKIILTQKMLEELAYIKDYVLVSSKVLDLNGIQVNVIRTSHDVDSLGYVISYQGKSLVYITDTGYINQKYFKLLTNRQVYILESNHDIEMLLNSKYDRKLKQRILSDKGHLSNADCARYLSKLIGNNTISIVLAHLSKDNNNEELAVNTTKNKLNNKDLNILVASEKKALEMIEI